MERFSFALGARGGTSPSRKLTEGEPTWNLRGVPPLGLPHASLSLKEIEKAQGKLTDKPHTATGTKLSRTENKGSCLTLFLMDQKGGKPPLFYLAGKKNVRRISPTDAHSATTLGNQTKFYFRPPVSACMIFSVFGSGSGPN